MLIRLRHAHFLIRVSDPAAGFAKRRRELGTEEWLVTFHPAPATRRKKPWLPTEIPARLIRYPAPGFRPSWSITSLMDVEAYTREEWVALYHRRWRIEEFHKCEKTGCQVEMRRLEHVDRLEPLIGLLSVLAVRRLQLKFAARDEPEEPARTLFDDLTVRLMARYLKRPSETLTFGEFWRGIGRLGVSAQQNHC